MRRIVAASIVPLAFASGVLTGRAQQASRSNPGQTVFRGQVNLVQISVVATGPDGRPVHGLTRDDFRVIAQGSERPIEGFAEVASPRPPASPFPSTLAKDVSDNISAKSDRVVILVLDDLHLHSSRQADVVKALARRVVNGIGEGTTIGLITTSGVFGLEPTGDRARVLAVIDDFVITYQRVDERHLPPKVRLGWDSEGAVGGVLQREFDDLTVLKANQDVAHMLVASGPQRKAFVWISGGQEGMCPEPPAIAKGAPPSSEGHRCVEMLYEMQRADISTYAVDPEDGYDGFLRGVADATGGLAIRANDLEAGLDRIVDDLNNYYLIGFVPADPTDTHYREIKIQVNRPGVSLRYRDGFTATFPPNVNTPKDLSPTAALVAGVLPKTDLRMRLSATPLSPAAAWQPALVAVSLELHGEAARLAQQDGRLHDSLRFQIVAVDLRKKRSVLSRTEQRDIAWPASGAREGETAYEVTTELPLEPGSYQLRTSADSTVLGTAGSVYLIVDVPDWKTALIALGGLLLGYADGPHIASVASGDAAALPFLPTLDREFSPSQNLRLLCDFWRAPSVADVELAVDLIDQADHVVRSESTEVGEADRSRLDTRLSLDGLPPAAYRLRVTATAGSFRDSREVGITVR